MGFWYNESMAILKRLTNNFFDLVFPVECLGCGKDGVFVCDECLKGIELKGDFPCVVCGKKAFFGRTHKECLKETSIDGALCATEYKEELVGRMIRGFKYNLVRDFGPSLGWVMMKYLKGLMKRVLPRLILEEGMSEQRLRLIKMAPNFLLHAKPILIPIPLHARRRRERGFNQAEILARTVGHYFDWPVLTHVLTRKKYTSAQANLKARARAGNIKDAFLHTNYANEDANYLPRRQAGANMRINDERIKNRTVILIDDVLTTGATMNEAGRVLKGMGVGEVWGCV